MIIRAAAALAAVAAIGYGGATVLTSSAISDSLPLQLVAETQTKVTFAWVTPSRVEGYVFKIDSARVSNTWQASRTQVTFGKPGSGQHVYEVDAITDAIAGRQTVPVPAQPTTATTTIPPPTTTVTTTVAAPAAYNAESFDNGWNASVWVPTGTGSITTATDPAGGPNQALRLYTAVGAGGPNSSSSMASLFENQPNAYGRQGLDTWYRADLYLPPDYVPSEGQWNWLTEWHISDNVPQNPGGVSNSVGIYTDYTNPPTNAHLSFRVSGGNYNSPTQATKQLGPLQIAHWYRVGYHFHWSQGFDGLAEWYVDGQLVWSYTGPNLFLTTAGQPDQVGYGLYNYHVVPATPTRDYPITVWFDNAEVGPTRASVGL